MGITDTPTPAVPAYEPGVVLVRWKDGIQATAYQAATIGPPELRIQALRVPDVAAALDELHHNPAVLYAEPNYAAIAAVAPDDAFYDVQWGLANIHAPVAWNTATAGARILGIDSGLNYNHPDLAANVWTNPGEIPGNGLDDDGNGYVDDLHGVDVFNHDSDPMDDFYHGSHTLGIAGAVGNNDLGVSGVAWDVDLAACKFLNQDGLGFYDDGIQCFAYAVNNGFGISLNAWSGGYSQALYDTVAWAGAHGHLVIASAGNSPTIIRHYPAGFDLPNVLSVAAIEQDDRLASFSSYGPTVDLAAPGSGILSTELGDGYTSASGTSMAAAYVTGAAALLWAQYPDWTWQQVRAHLLATTRPLPSLTGKVQNGTLDLARLFLVHYLYLPLCWAE